MATQGISGEGLYDSVQQEEIRKIFFLLKPDSEERELTDVIIARIQSSFRNPQISYVRLGLADVIQLYGRCRPGFTGIKIALIAAIRFFPFPPGFFRPVVLRIVKVDGTLEAAHRLKTELRTEYLPSHWTKFRLDRWFKYGGLLHCSDTDEIDFQLSFLEDREVFSGRRCIDLEV